MYRLKSFIENIGQDREITKELKVENGIVYLETDENKYKYEYGNWYIWCDIHWVNLQGGIPNYETKESSNSDFFEKIDEGVQDGE